jgi:hypothetical protein
VFVFVMFVFVVCGVVCVVWCVCAGVKIELQPTHIYSLLSIYSFSKL